MTKPAFAIWTASSEFGTYRLCKQRRFRRACASAQSRENLRCSLIQAVSQEEPSDRKPDPCPLWMAGHAQLKFVMTECSKTQIRLTGLICEQQRGRSACAACAFVVHCLDSKIPLVSISEISSLYLASLAVQAGLCLSWSQTLKIGFLMTRLIFG